MFLMSVALNFLFFIFATLAKRSNTINTLSGFRLLFRSPDFSSSERANTCVAQGGAVSSGKYSQPHCCFITCAAAVRSLVSNSFSSSLNFTAEFFYLVMVARHDKLRLRGDFNKVEQWEARKDTLWEKKTERREMC